MADKKHYIITSLTLGAIAATSAALIGLTNLITAKKIADNEKAQINAGIGKIYGKSASILSDSDLDEYKYSNHLYTVKTDESENNIALRTTGSNMYGKISLLVGFSLSEEAYTLVGLYVVTNEQTYASTLVENYITPLNNGERDLDDVSCGATYGAKLIREMVNEAKEVANQQLGKGE